MLDAGTANTSYEPVSKRSQNAESCRDVIGGSNATLESFVNPLIGTLCAFAEGFGEMAFSEENFSLTSCAVPRRRTAKRVLGGFRPDNGRPLPPDFGFKEIFWL